MAKLRISSQRHWDGKWETKVDAIIRGDGRNISECLPVVIIFDTQCHVDIVSTHLLKDTFGLTINYSAPRCIGKTITGENINSVGEVDLRWWGRDRGWFRPRFEDLRAFVVESNAFELIIGRETMKRVLINPSNSMIGVFVSNPPSHDSKLEPVVMSTIADARSPARTVAAEQQDANLRRDEHREERQRRREQKVCYLDALLRQLGSADHKRHRQKRRTARNRRLNRRLNRRPNRNHNRA